MQLHSFCGVTIFNSVTSSAKLSNLVIGLWCKLSASETISGEVVLDSTVGKDTTFSFAWSSSPNQPTITLTGPDGTVYNSPKVDTKTKTLTYMIPGVAKVSKVFANKIISVAFRAMQHLKLRPCHVQCSPDHVNQRVCSDYAKSLK